MQRDLFTTDRDPSYGKHHGAPTSVAAFDRVLPTVQAERYRILAWLAGVEEGTSREYLAWTNERDQKSRGLNHVSGRFTELAEAGAIEKTGSRRDGCAVYRLMRSN